MKRLLVVLLLSVAAHAQYSQRQAVVLTSAGKPANQATVRVCASSDSTCVTPITVYSSATGAAKTNPFVTDSVGNYSFYAPTGYYTVKETYQGSSYVYQILLGNPSHSMYYADQYPQATTPLKIVQACLDAGATGIVIVPPGMASGDPTAFTSGCTVFDYRGGGIRQLDSDGSKVYESFKTSLALSPDTHGYLEYYSVARPAGQNCSGCFPLGSDNQIQARGSADIHLNNVILSTTSSTNVASPGTQNITVGSTTNFADSAGVRVLAPIVINRGKSDEETVGTANWSVVNSVTMNITFAKAHVTLPYTVDMRGTVIVDTPQIMMRASDNSTQLFAFQETRDASGLNPTIKLFGNTGRTLLAVKNSNTVPGWYGKSGTGLSIFGSDGATTTNGIVTVYDNDTDNNVIFAVSSSGHSATIQGSSATHPRLFIKDNLFASGVSYSINSGQAAASTLDMVDETNGVRFFTYDPSNFIRLLKNTAVTGSLSATTYSTATNCSSSASPAVCSTASAGSVVVAAATTAVTVNTTAVTANSQIFLQNDSSLGTKLGVTCNTQSSLVLGTPRVTARVAGTSFSIAIEVGPTTNPMCISYRILN